MSSAWKYARSNIRGGPRGVSEVGFGRIGYAKKKEREKLNAAINRLPSVGQLGWAQRKKLQTAFHIKKMTEALIGMDGDGI